MKITFRTCTKEDDFWRTRNFLREIFLLNGRNNTPLFRIEFHDSPSGTQGAAAIYHKDGCRSLSSILLSKQHDFT